MNFTYSGDPSANNRDQVRFLVQDTDPADPQLSDEEVAYLISSAGTAKKAAIAGARALWRRYARLDVDKTVGDLSISASQRASQFKAVLEDLEREEGGASASVLTPWAGGIDSSAKTTEEAEATRVAPFFSRDMLTAGVDDLEDETD